MQRALLQYFLPQNHRLVVKGLKMAGRTDLIGTGPGCLVPPLKEEQHSSGSSPKKETKNARPSNRPNARTGSAAASSQNGRRGRQKNNRKG